MPSDGDGLYDAVRKMLPKDQLKDYDALIDNILSYDRIFDKSEQDLIDETVAFAAYFSTAAGISFKVNKENIGGWTQHALFMSMGIKHDYSEYLKQIHANTLILHGDQDIISVESMQQYMPYLPNARLKIIKGGSHFSFNDAPEAFSKYLLAFLRS